MELPGPDQLAAYLAAVPDGWVQAMGLRYVSATLEEVVAEFDVSPQHQQAHGIVHGGVHAGFIETLCSIGAALHAFPRGQTVVGLENHTTFLRAVREGRLRVVARPVHVGRTTQVWDGEVVDDSGRRVATGRVRLQCLDASASLGGAVLGHPGERGGGG